MADRFPSPFEIPTPPGAEGWQDMYVYPSLFSEARRDYEDSMFWFQDGVHWPKVLTPWDATFFEFALASLSQYNSRHLQVPPANGIALRILNGYAYLTPIPADPTQIEARVANFMDRAGFYFMNWNDLYDKWMVKIRGLVGELRLCPSIRCRRWRTRMRWSSPVPVWGAAIRFRRTTAPWWTSR
ncbi:MAG: hypothetical protein ACKOW5_14265 [Actinomycetales bacterium]